MNAFEVYLAHNQTINGYLVLYIIRIVLLIVVAFWVLRSVRQKPFY